MAKRLKGAGAACQPLLPGLEASSGTVASLPGASLYPAPPTPFDRFFRAVHGYPPFPWQSRLAADLGRGIWPELCNLPPASGKTAWLDIWAYALAMASDVRPRTVPVRLAFVVDRRLVVNDAHARALHIAARLEWALRRAEAGQGLGVAGDGVDPVPSAEDEDVLREVALRLATLSGPPGEARRPLQVSVMRGGMPRDNSWVDSPQQPTIMVSTVDQVGSRLLFRGYGVSNRMQPVHAGLLGTDCLHVLDEAHLSNPYAQTLAAVASLRTRAVVDVGLPWRMVTLTATPAASDRVVRTFGLDMDRAGPDRAAAPVLDQRFAARKMTRLVRMTKTTTDAQAAEFARLAAKLARPGGVIAVVVNRVQLARAVHEVLAKEHGIAGQDPATGGSVLLTGRSRPLERDKLLGVDTPHDPGAPYARIIDRIRTGRSRNGQGTHAPLFVVGTQAIEAGADLDFDALITEVASWPSLRQRFGRLDRAGMLGISEAIIVCSAKSTASGQPIADPIYGGALHATQEWLWGLAGPAPGKAGEHPGRLNLGVDGTSALGPAPEEAVQEQRSAPSLTPGIMDLFAQTSPRPYPDPDPALWLHGPASNPPDVQIVWRQDAPAAEANGERGEHWAAYTGALAACPPVSAEVLALPVWTARRWLAGLSFNTDLADVTPMVGEVSDVEKNPQGRVFVWRGLEGSGLTRIADLKPGDTVVLASARGGCDKFGWLPAPLETTFSVEDLAGPAILKARGKHVIWLHPAVLGEERWQVAQAVLKGMEVSASAATVVAALRLGAPGLLPDNLGRPVYITPYMPENDTLTAGAVLVGKVLRDAAPPASVRLDLLEDDDQALLASGEVRLDQHLTGVRRVGMDSAMRVGLPASLVADIGIACGGHDVGKAEIRFQAVLRGGDTLAAVRGPALAKSLAADGGAALLASVAEEARLPAGIRHECWSVQMLRGSEGVSGCHDPQLVLWLVGTHHGHGRPWFEHVPDPEPLFPVVDFMLCQGGAVETVSGTVKHNLHRADAGWPDLFGRLLTRYDWWGLAYLEAVVRLADACQSRTEQEVAERGISGVGGSWDGRS